MRLNELKIDFIGKSKILFPISCVLVAISILLVIFKSFNFGIDFAGGTEIQIKADGVTQQQVREVMGQFGANDIQQFEGKQNEYLVRFKNISMVDDATINAFLDAAKAKFTDAKMVKTHFDSQVGDRVEIWFDKEISQDAMNALIAETKLPVIENDAIKYNKVGDRHIYKLMLKGMTNEIVIAIDNINKEAKADLVRVELVGPKVGQQLKLSAIMAVFYALIAILVYIAFRFNFMFAPGAVLALFHDVMIALGIWSLFGFSFDLTVVAALLTIVGYSINDTIVIFDRIRENMKDPNKGTTLAEKMNTSLNETLQRTFLTSITTLFSVLALLIFGGEIISGFAGVMCIGVVVGTYSSLFIASPITLYIERYMNKKRGNAA